MQQYLLRIIYPSHNLLLTWVNTSPSNAVFVIKIDRANKFNHQQRLYPETLFLRLNFTERRGAHYCLGNPISLFTAGGGG